MDEFTILNVRDEQDQVLAYLHYQKIFRAEINETYQGAEILNVLSNGPTNLIIEVESIELRQGHATKLINEVKKEGLQILLDCCAINQSKIKLNALKAFYIGLGFKETDVTAYASLMHWLPKNK